MLEGWTLDAEEDISAVYEINLAGVNGRELEKKIWMRFARGLPYVQLSAQTTKYHEK